MKVKEIMTRDVLSVSPDDNAKEALDILLERKISGLPVLDVDGKIAGMFTEKEVLSYALPSYLGKVGSFIYEENPKSINKKFVDLSNLKVSDIMRREVAKISEEVNISEVARVMLVHKLRRIVVTDASDRVIGMVSRGDVVRSLFVKAMSGV